MDSIDKLLAQLKTEYDDDKLPQPQPNVGKSFSPIPTKSTSLMDNLLAEVQADFVAQDVADELRKQQELEQKRIQQEQIKAKQLAGLKSQAKDWLAKLDPLSTEGLWFESFAQGYPSKLEAAIEYLQSN